LGEIREEFNMMFTEKMKTVLMSTDEKYKYIWRSAAGNLYLTTTNKDREIFASAYPFDAYSELFRGIKSGRRPLRFRPDVLDDVEKEYLKSVLAPFRNRVVGIKKLSIIDGNRIVVNVMDERTGEIDVLMFPSFSEHSNMYAGMKEEREYTLKELGI
jgi:hypothetical protein